MTLADPDAPTALQTRLPVEAPPLAPARRRWRRLGAATPFGLDGVLIGIAVLASVVGVLARFSWRGSLWLDEALTVNISRLPVPRLFDALRHDGSPPAYYLLLHFWMRLFGTSGAAVRTLPALLSIATIPAAYALGRVIAGRRTGLFVAILFATSPFAIRYGSENRMYSLVMLLVTLGGVALVGSLRNPTPRRLVALGVCSGLLLLTHYWAVYLLAVAGGLLLWRSIRGEDRMAPRFALAALASGSLLFLPWVPSFLFQAKHTGTPWSTAPSPSMFLYAVGEFAGWERRYGAALFTFYCILFGCLLLLVLFSSYPWGRRPASLLGMRTQVPGERWAGPAAAIALGTLGLALVGGLVASAAFAYRYASVVFPATMVLAALGAGAVGVTWGGRRLAAALVATCALLGLPAGISSATANRTQAAMIADRIQSVAQPGDVVAYCPDQLGPAVSRLLPNRYVQVTFPRLDAPELINWVDYAKVNAAAPAPGVMARELVDLAGPGHQVWLVWEIGYRTLGQDCEELKDALVALRPNFTQPVRSDPRHYYEHENLDRFAPT